MSAKIEISQEFFINLLVEKLKSINGKLNNVDDKLFNGPMQKEWELIRSCNLEIDELIKALGG